MAPRQPKPPPKPYEITITVHARSIIDGVLPEAVLRTLAAELVTRIGDQARPNCMSVDLKVTAVECDRRPVW